VRKFFVGTLVAAVGTIGFGAVASASDDGYNPPPAVLNVCDAGHGAFGAFSHHFQGGTSFEGGTISQDAIADGGMGAETGPANSGLGQACAPGLNR